MEFLVFVAALADVTVYFAVKAFEIALGIVLEIVIEMELEIVLLVEVALTLD